MRWQEYVEKGMKRQRRALKRNTAGRALRSLTSWFFEGKLVPVIGAGASKDLGVPLWGALAKSMATGYVRDPGDLTTRDLLLAFELMSQKGELFWDDLRDQLFSSTEEGTYFEDADPSTLKTGELWASEKCTHDSSLQYLAALCILNALLFPERAFHVMTYNLDTLLEEKIAALGHRAIAITDEHEAVWEPVCEPSGSEPLVTERPSMHVGQRADIRVFHPHGLVLRASKARALGREQCYIKPMMRLSDYEYLANNTLGGVGLLQLQALRNLRGFFYGFSFSDPNVRRLASLTIQLGAEEVFSKELDWRSGWRRSKRDFDWIRHIILLSTHQRDAEIRCRSLFGPFSASSEPSAEERLQYNLTQLRMLRVGFWSVKQHKILLIRLLHSINRDLRFQWPAPGFSTPPGGRVGETSAHLKID